MSCFGLNASATESVLRWGHNDDADYYLVYWRTAGEPTPTHHSEKIPVGTTSIKLADLPQGQFYYSVKAFNAYGNSSDFSKEVLATNLPEGENYQTDQSPTTEIIVEILLPENEVTGFVSDVFDFSCNVDINGRECEHCEIEWTSDIDNLLGIGADTQKSLSAGNHKITATVSDGNGNTGTDTVSVFVGKINTAPVVQVYYLKSSVPGLEGQVVAFSGSANDAEDGGLGDRIIWKSSLDGSIGTGSRIQPVLSPGKHTITGTVTDNNGQDANDSLYITVESYNHSPVVVITQAIKGVTGFDGQPVDFYGTANDTEDGNLSSHIRWTSSINGNLGTGVRVQPTLSPGLHTITADITDGNGKSGTSTHSITIEKYNTPPVVTISKSSASIVEGQFIEFSGIAKDTEDGNLSSHIIWSSSIDGRLGAGVKVQPALSPGQHTITGAVTDEKGKIGTGTLSIAVEKQNTQVVGTTLISSGNRSITEGQSIKISAPEPVTTETVTYNAGTTAESAIEETAAYNGGAAVVMSEMAVKVEEINEPPTIEIIQPSGNVSGVEGQMFELLGKANDSEDGDLNYKIFWTSSIDGELGTGPYMLTALSAGNHRVTAEVVDNHGIHMIESLTISVEPQTTIDLNIKVYNFYYIKIIRLTWSGASSGVNIYGDDRLLGRGASRGSKYYRQRGIDKFSVCEKGSSACSEDRYVQ